MLRPFYFCYFIAVGISLPFFPPYLRNLGLTGKQVSTVLAIAPLMHLGVPLGWGWFADRTRRPDLLLRLACLGAFIFYFPLIFVRSMPALLFVIALHQMFAVAISGLGDSLAIERVRHGDDYGRIRVWGSIGFIAATLAVAPVLTARGHGAPRGDPLVPLLVASALALAFVATLRLHGHGIQGERPHTKDVHILLHDKRFLFLLAVAPLHWACLAPYHGFFAILLQDRGLSPTVIGNAFVVSVIGELLAFYFFRNVRGRFSLSALLAWSFGATAVRWLATAFTRSPFLLVALQGLHALTFGMFWASALAWIAECVPTKLRATGQTLFTAATLGVGSIVGLFGSGTLYDLRTGATPAFLAAAAVELIPLGLTLKLGRRLDRTSGS